MEVLDMTKSFKRLTIALLIIGPIFLSGIAGFIGAYFGQHLYSKATVSEESILNNNISLKNTKNTSGEALSYSEIADFATNSVVEITTETVTGGLRMRQYISEGAGSGVILSKDGYIVTNNHVISDANKITVTTTNGKNYAATLIGTDAKTDLAVLKIKATDLQPVQYADSSKLAVGESVIAIGNPLGELGGTVTEGIISALNRDIVIDGETMNLLQTSAAINPGNSGGGLFNQYGKLIGIVNAKSSGSDIEGLGFAIPANTVKKVAEDLIAHGYVQGRVDTGLSLIDVSNERTAMLYKIQRLGLYVLQATDDARQFQPGDFIESVEGTEVSTLAEFNKIIDQHKVGDTISIIVSRGRNKLEINLTLKQFTH